MNERLDEIIKLLKIQTELLDKLFKLFNKYDDQYLTETEEERVRLNA